MEHIPAVVRKGGLSLIIYFFIALTSALISLIATRKLSPEDFGYYQFLGISVSLFTVLVNSLGWFATRLVARGYKVDLELWLYSIYVTAFSDILLFLALLAVSSFSFPIRASLIYLSLLLLFTQSIMLFLSSILQGSNPPLSYLANLIQSLSRLILLLSFIYFLGFRLTIELFLIAGVISNILASSLSLYFVLKIKGTKLAVPIRIVVLKLWQFPLVFNLLGTVLFYDAVIVTSLLSSPLVLAYFRSAFVVSLPITYVQVFITNYYREFLEKDSIQGFRQAFRMISLLSLMFSFLVISVGDVLLSILKSFYISSYPAAIMLSLAFLIANISSLFSFSLLSMEKIDISVNSASLRRSILFEVTKIMLFQLAFQYVALFLLIYFSKSFSLRELSIAIYWSAIWLGVNVLGLLLYYRAYIRRFSFNFPLSIVAKYILASSLASLVAYFLKKDLFAEGFFEQLMLASIPVSAYLASFLSIVLLLDGSIRRRVFLIFKSLFSSFH